ncbi:hypothetical protein VCHENC02_1217B, partial [Vibrio harveyi]
TWTNNSMFAKTVSNTWKTHYCGPF